MKKPVEKRKITYEASERWLRNWGESIWMRKWWLLILLILIIPVVIIGVVHELAVNPSDIIVFGGIGYLIGWYVVITVILNRIGKRYWDKVKDKDQPIELDPLPKLWGK